MKQLMNIVRTRKSVRTYDGNQIRKDDLAELKRYVTGLSNPWGIPVRCIFLDAKEKGLSSPVLTGETMYVAGIIQRVPYAEAAFGYSFERLVLHAWSLGIGTVFIGGTMKRDLFERAAELQTGFFIPCVSPLGYPAEKRSIRETLMRKGVGADTRLSADKLFYEDAYGKPLSPEKSRGISDLIELVRLAPSAVNKQPWRIICSENGYHFYEKKSNGFEGERTGDLQLVDMGIAVCHFMMGMEEMGMQPSLTVRDPGISVPSDLHYIATVTE